jgi:tRNA G18 (ribose-2'-O)-methylase SpoU
VDWLYYENTVDAVLALKERGYKVLAIEQTEGSIMLDQYVDKQLPTAFVFGNEVDGVTDEVIQVCDGVIEIPQWGMKHSLNISVAAAVVMWEFVRKVD